MALNQAAYVSELLKVTDPDNPEFIGFPETPEEVAEAWMVPLQKMFETMSIPAAGAAAAPVAKDAGVAAMAPLVTPPPPPLGLPPLALAALAAGHLAFAGAIAAAAPVSVPPPAPFVPPISPPGLDPVAPANAIAAAALAWAITGTWTPGPPPAPVPWA